MLTVKPAVAPAVSWVRRSVSCLVCGSKGSIEDGRAPAVLSDSLPAAAPLWGCCSPDSAGISDLSSPSHRRLSCLQTSQICLLFSLQLLIFRSPLQGLDARPPSASRPCPSIPPRVSCQILAFSVSWLSLFQKPTGLPLPLEDNQRLHGGWQDVAWPPLDLTSRYQVPSTKYVPHQAL